MNIVEEIKKRRHGSLIAIKDGDLQLSFDDLFKAVAEVSAQLQGHSAIADNELPRIGVKFPNGLGYIVVALAVLESRACFVPIPDELTEAEQQTLISETALHGVISASPEGNIQLPCDLGTALLESSPHVLPGFPQDEFNAIGPAFIRFSSGTTAASKGVILSHQSLFDRIHAANQGLEIQAGENVLWTLPMAHHFAVSIVLYLYFGATTVLETSHQPEQIYLAAKASGSHILYGSPFHFAQLAQCKSAEPLPELRLAMSTASALSEGVAQAFEERFNLPLTQALGIIEVGLPVMNLLHAHDQPAALGQVLSDYEWKSQAHGNDPNIGELLLRGPGMFDAYLSPWKMRAELCPNGWFATGDLVELTDNNTLIMRGRSKSVINVGGMKVFPEEIEAVLNEHPDIEKSRVTAGHHPTLGSYPSAEIIVAENKELPSSADLRSHCAARLAPYKLPVQFKPVDQIELTASGKVKRH
ncbi:AMP-binding protein [Oceaniferula spumae]|uniref:AMP-binding protein n=1 Tax=Oceaniferula spumae TaxID=2979115 RepID=A0AAT9FPG0_9BACT